ncbi:MAG TPA: DUF366 family protein [Planctomycetota bacterium]|nr:DUF366 family protein [Planctomycetota bacterium]
MKAHLAPGRVDYDGSQIHSLWAYRTYGVQGDSIVAFQGACEIPFSNMVDLEDVRAKSRIASPLMLHFICEHFDLDLEKAVLRQRLLAAIVRDELGGEVRRDGDDLFLGPGKLSISIATLTPVSSKIHFGINIRRELHVNVETRGLEDLRVDPTELAGRVLTQYAAQIDGIHDARTRVRGVP